MSKKTSWKLRVSVACLCILLTAGVAWTAGLFDRDNQYIRGEWTFAQDVDFEGNVNIDGTLTAQQYSSVFYVHSGTGADVPQNGESRTAPYATLNYAVAACTADKGDIIIVMPGHNEEATAAQIDFDVTGIKILGFGQGTNTPTIDFDNTFGETFPVVIGANNVTVQGLRFRPSCTGLTTGLHIEHGISGISVIGCEFGWEESEAGTDEFMTALDIGGDSGAATSTTGVAWVTIEKCVFNAGEAGAGAAIHLSGPTTGVVIKDNTIRGDYATGCIINTHVKAEELLIDNNFFYNGVNSGLNTSLPIITLVTGSNGIISNNTCFVAGNSSPGVIIHDACYLSENYWTASSTPNRTIPIGVAGPYSN